MFLIIELQTNLWLNRGHKNFRSVLDVGRRKLEQLPLVYENLLALSDMKWWEHFIFSAFSDRVSLAHLSWLPVSLQSMYYADYYGPCYQRISSELAVNYRALHRALLLCITWQWTLWETFQGGSTPACLMLVVAPLAINKRGNVF